MLCVVSTFVPRCLSLTTFRPRSPIVLSHPIFSRPAEFLYACLVSVRRSLPCPVLLECDSNLCIFPSGPLDIIMQWLELELKAAAAAGYRKTWHRSAECRERERGPGKDHGKTTTGPFQFRSSEVRRKHDRASSERIFASVYARDTKCVLYDRSIYLRTFTFLPACNTTSPSRTTLSIVDTAR